MTASNEVDAAQSACAAAHREWSARFTEVVAGVRDWDVPTPVAEWRARDIVTHLVTWLPGLLRNAADVDLPIGPDPKHDPVGAWMHQRDAVQQLLESPRAATVFTSEHFGETSVYAMVGQYYNPDIFMHTWDLARATGQDDTLDEATVAEMLEGMRSIEPMLRASGQFGEQQPVRDGASVQEQFIAFIGRDPYWQPPTRPRTDWGAVYRAAVDGIEQVAQRLEPGDADRTVAATPEWTVQQLFAHLAGGATDAVNGRLDGVPGPEWTGRHVAERSAASVAELARELRDSTDAAIATLAGADSPALVWDKVIHLGDLHETLGLGRPDPATFTDLARTMRRNAEKMFGVVLPAELDDWTVTRVAFSRRSQAQLRELLAAEGLDPEQLRRVGVFGPREDDQPTC